MKPPPLPKAAPPSARTIDKRRRIAPHVPTEHAIQAAFVAWTRIAVAQHPDLALGFAVPNGGHRHKLTAAKLQAEGVRPGVPDWILPVPRAEFTGLAIEFKRPGGELSKAQADYIPRLTKAGWLVLVCDDAAAAMASTLHYLRLTNRCQRDN